MSSTVHPPRIKQPIEEVVEEIEAIRERVERRAATTRIKRVSAPTPSAPTPTTGEPEKP